MLKIQQFFRCRGQCQTGWPQWFFDLLYPCLIRAFSLRRTQEWGRGRLSRVLCKHRQYIALILLLTLLLLRFKVKVSSANLMTLHLRCIAFFPQHSLHLPNLQVRILRNADSMKVAVYTRSFSRWVGLSKNKEVFIPMFNTTSWQTTDLFGERVILYEWQKTNRTWREGDLDSLFTSGCWRFFNSFLSDNNFPWKDRATNLALVASCVAYWSKHLIKIWQIFSIIILPKCLIHASSP